MIIEHQCYKVNLSELSLQTLTRGWGSQLDRSMRVDTAWTHSREVTYEGGVTYLWLMPTGQYEMKQTSVEVRCIRNDREWMLVLNE